MADEKADAPTTVAGPSVDLQSTAAQPTVAVAPTEPVTPPPEQPAVQEPPKAKRDELRALRALPTFVSGFDFSDPGIALENPTEGGIALVTTTGLVVLGHDRSSFQQLVTLSPADTSDSETVEKARQTLQRYLQTVARKLSSDEV